MNKIKKFSYKEEQFSFIKDCAFGKDWLVVYILTNKKGHPKFFRCPFEEFEVFLGNGKIKYV